MTENKEELDTNIPNKPVVIVLDEDDGYCD